MQHGRGRSWGGGIGDLCEAEADDAAAGGGAPGGLAAVLPGEAGVGPAAEHARPAEARLELDAAPEDVARERGAPVQVEDARDVLPGVEGAARGGGGLRRGGGSVGRVGCACWAVGGRGAVGVVEGDGVEPLRHHAADGGHAPSAVRAVLDGGAVAAGRRGRRCW
jgi:hypothetical protein